MRSSPSVVEARAILLPRSAGRGVGPALPPGCKRTLCPAYRLSLRRSARRRPAAGLAWRAPAYAAREAGTGAPRTEPAFLLSERLLRLRFEFCEPAFVVGNCLQIASDSHQYDRIYCGAGVQKDHENYMKILLKVGGILVMPIEDQLTQIMRTGQNTWESKNILAVSFAPLVQPSKNDNGTPDSVGLPPCAVRNLQDLARIYIRRTLRNFINDEMQAKGIPQRAPPKRKRKRVKQRINTYVFVGNQLIPQPLDSEEDEKMEEDSKEEEEKDHSETIKHEEPPQNLLREKIMKLPLPESLKAYLTYFRDK
ncbi:protein-L-isoaspartate O-methyltransferase domain-containing protein 1 isoform X2 [Onychomys torridus]|uniref:protein-L-isoaspartate O-methyltransferase domain-containing protein 1 isoform X2 n=1 Tax=Onychomys torridus TaxID=38674 RepID=UPI00167FAF08|nr:protein-L-isoaspartate O-methyltransferase domain-containing protein 1 isoform X2 [Onychomys torridus]